jgi:hypothetical protein
VEEGPIYEWTDFCCGNHPTGPIQASYRELPLVQRMKRASLVFTTTIIMIQRSTGNRVVVVEHVLVANQLQVVTKAVVEAARDNFIIGD